MNGALAAFLGRDAEERRDIFDACAERLDTIPTYIEKDFWVCHVLDALYNGRAPDQPRLLFKGGTSLSKVFGVIQRFSEDIDIVVFRDDIGFTGDRDPTNPELSNKARTRLAQELKETASEFIRGALTAELVELFPDCKIVEDPDDSDQSTLLVQYPSLYDADSDAYVLPRVKIEGGARSALDPHALQQLLPYIADELAGENLSVDGLITIDPERTLLEKALILHGWHCGYRDQGRLPDDRNLLSRHYYDVAMLAPTPIADRAVEDTDLLVAVRDHAIKFFPRGWMRLREAQPGSIRLSPQDELASRLATDYTAMQGMILGDALPFDEVLARIAALEERLNAGA